MVMKVGSVVKRPFYFHTIVQEIVLFLVFLCEQSIVDYLIIYNLNEHLLVSCSVGGSWRLRVRSAAPAW